MLSPNKLLFSNILVLFELFSLGKEEGYDL